MDARTALNEYKEKGERVDEVLFHIVNEELNRLHAEIEQIHKSSIFQALAKIYDLSFQNNVLREALQFYANENNHFVVDMHARSSVHADGGFIARRALQQK
ncbi:hypothetical protein MKX47_12420 [Solibacillus sp. FSL R7-0668]|uniref:hypothetical protein n=1 Tax=Solibacillus sp. FSL R7-0668 TaxID=2921688 RepID=UPI0030F9B1AB